MEKAGRLVYMQVEEFARLINKSSDKTTSSFTGIEQRWLPPPEGWIKINVDASMMDSKSSLAFAVRDRKGKLFLLSTTVTSCRTPYIAE